MAKHATVFQLGSPSAFPSARRSALPAYRSSGRVLLPKVRASNENTTEAGASVSSENSNPASSGGTIFFAGKAYTVAEWEAAKASGQLAPVSVVSDSRAAGPSIAEIMAFSGPGPEIINGRLAMLGVVAAIAAEAVSGDSVLRQLAEEPTLIATTFVLFAVASLVPQIQNVEYEELAPFTARAEMLNGRLAMLGFAALLLIEAIKGTSLLG